MKKIDLITDQYISSELGQQAIQLVSSNLNNPEKFIRTIFRAGYLRGRISILEELKREVK